MKLVEKYVFVVLRLTRGASEVIAVFNELDHANKFIDKIRIDKPGTYAQEPSILYDFEPSEGELERIV